MISRQPGKPFSRKNAATPVDLWKELDAATLHRAEEIANRYTVLLEPHERRGFMARCLEFPTVWALARTESACVKKIRHAPTGGVAFMLHSGEAPPLPASEARRDQQVNIRLTAEERELLENFAKRRGYRGIPDFMRTAALSQTRRIT
jgi:predicted RNase H-like HicB family nuclease